MGANCLAALTVLAVISGGYTEAVSLGEEAWQAASARNDQADLALAGYGLTSAAIAQGRYDEAASQHAGRTLALTKAVGNRWFMAYVYNQLGEITQTLVDLDSAEEYYRASYVIREDFDDPEGMAVALTHLGAIALARNDNEQAETLYRQSATLLQRDRRSRRVGWAWHGSPMAALAQNQIERARQHLQQALEVAVETEITPLLLSVLVGVGTFLVQCGEAHWGLATWAFVPAITRQPTREAGTRFAGFLPLAIQGTSRSC